MVFALWPFVVPTRHSARHVRLTTFAKAIGHVGNRDWIIWQRVSAYDLVVLQIPFGDDAEIEFAGGTPLLFFFVSFVPLWFNFFTPCPTSKS